MLDSAAGCAVHSTLADGEHVRNPRDEGQHAPADPPGSGVVVAEGKVIHRGSRTAMAEATLTSAETGKRLAHATSTCLIMSG